MLSVRGVAFTVLSAAPQIVCVPHNWRVTLVGIVVANMAVSFMLEVRSASLCLHALIVFCL